MTEAVDWSMASRVAQRVAGSDPLAHSYRAGTLASDIAEFTPLAQELVEAETGWPSASGAARARVVDRAGWVEANIGSFQRLLAPLLDRAGEKMVGPSAYVAPKVAAAEMGVILGWMSRRVLGQYDLLVTEPGADPLTDGLSLTNSGEVVGDPEDQDLVYLVGPNLLAARAQVWVFAA